MKHIIAIIAAVALSGCILVNDTSTAPVDEGDKSNYTPIEFAFDRDNPRAVPSAAEQKRCTDVGGTVVRDGLLGAYRCMQTYPDAGAACRDASDCLGDCRNTGELDYGKSVTGQCQTTDSPFGCFSNVRDGRAEPMLCVD